MNDYNKNYDTLAELIDMELINAEQVMNLFINWHGLGSLDDNFMDFVHQEIGY